MKIKVAELKKRQGWLKQAPCCANCDHFSSEMVTEKTVYGHFTKEKNKRCGFGSFATGKSNWCMHHRAIGLFD